MLPGMIGQLNFVRIEELVAEKIAQSVIQTMKVSKKARTA